ncbi:hypothetical protein ACSYAD_33850 [Acaryochloris marina NIES-2412]|uniref:hypothetical protein n=1 Tax=Acaryochloris marina TaxID=155978 RepID=UPI00405A0A95
MKNILILTAFASALAMSLPLTARSNDADLSVLQPCIPDTQARYRVERVEIIGAMPYQGGTLYHAALVYKGQPKGLEGETMILVAEGRCREIYGVPGGGDPDPLTTVFPKREARRLTLQWMERRVELSGFDAIQASLNDPRLRSLSDEMAWAYRQLGFSIPSYVQIKN